ncbi:amino acid ABC transporter ATP-binding protein [Leucobacter sp. wl10]|uniref:amino acid ABC transporter ATP-binding protein n=1 Tax=Leucobacter sp. wl10 TaxID=2304677 RepID=UPI000E5BDD79|nr:amino acid ABC transporter ATP-binding protein [Leucobacter sp. wl10]RGE21016.1 amino acid ABC transporter ATP-binding protein [Leucobacter sp. wl10]
MAFLELNGLRKSYGDHEVLRGIDLHIEQHQVVCLIGASGCGKSTLLRTINGLEEIQEGEIRLDDECVSGEGVDLDRLRTRIGIVFQSFNLFPHMTVLDNVTLGPRRVLGVSAREAEEFARKLLARVGLEAKADSYPDQLSGGQQQRVAIVRAVAMNTDVLLLDEITSALDPELVAEVLNIVKDLAADGLTILMATHEMNFARDVADSIAFLHEGRVLEQGPPEQIFGAPRAERTREFLSQIIAAGRL